MKKYDLLYTQLNNNNGYIFTAEVEAADISKTYLAKFIRDNNLEKVTNGIYVSEDTWPDDLFILQKKNPKIIYSSETALYLHGLTDREYSKICVSVPSGYHNSRLREKGIILHQEKEPIYNLGVTTVETNFGNTISVHNKERCICDLIKNKTNYEIQTFQTAIKTYMQDKNKDLTSLLLYSNKLGIRDEVMKYVEVLT